MSEVTSCRIVVSSSNSQVYESTSSCDNTVSTPVTDECCELAVCCSQSSSPSPPKRSREMLDEEHTTPQYCLSEVVVIDSAHDVDRQAIGMLPAVECGNPPLSPSAVVNSGEDASPSPDPALHCVDVCDAKESSIARECSDINPPDCNDTMQCDCPPFVEGCQNSSDAPSNDCNAAKRAVGSGVCELTSDVTCVSAVCVEQSPECHNPQPQGTNDTKPPACNDAMLTDCDEAKRDDCSEQHPHDFHDAKSPECNEVSPQDCSNTDREERNAVDIGECPEPSGHC